MNGAVLAKGVNNNGKYYKELRLFVNQGQTQRISITEVLDILL